MFLSLFIFYEINAQDERDYATELAKLEAELDSLSIFSLLDSILSISYQAPSEFIIRSGYSSNMVNAGRNYGIDQYGVSTGLSYYHKNGLYGDVSSYWNSDFEPMYTVSMISVGYINSYKSKVGYGINYERWIYNEKLYESSSGFQNNLGGFATVDMGPLFIGLDYSFLFNSTKTAHRVIGSVASNLNLKNTWIFDKVSFMPNVNLVYGNDEVTIYYQGSLVDGFRSEQLLRTELERNNLDEFLQNVALSPNEQSIVDNIQNENRFNPREKRRRILGVLLNNPEVQDYLYSQLDEIKNQYGIMSYSCSIPINLQLKNWRWMMAYTYSIPVSLPGEQYELEPISYFSASMSYRFRISLKTQ